MKIGIITKPNAKGQIVIPQKIRQKYDINSKTVLNILVKNDGFFVSPIKEVYSQAEQSMGNDAYLELLKRSRGAWGVPSKAELKKEQSRRKHELSASQRRKQAW